MNIGVWMENEHVRRLKEFLVMHWLDTCPA